MSLSVVQPSAPLPSGPTSRLRLQVHFSPPNSTKSIPHPYTLQVPSFFYNGTAYVLTHHLAQLWNFPSSYQVICKMVKESQVAKAQLLRTTDSALNKLLHDHKLILQHLLHSKLFYMEVELLVQILDTDHFLFGARVADLPVVSAEPEIPDDELITVSQVFPGFENIQEQLPLTYGSFLSLNPLTKLRLYKHDGVYRKVCGTNLSAFERELIYNSNNYFLDDVIHKKNEPVASTRKPVVRQRKVIGNTDPNKADVADYLLPGAGHIPEFNVSSICKAPNYFVTTNQMNLSSQNSYPVGEHLKTLQLRPEDAEIPPQLYQALLNTDQDAFHFKYYYFKNYRGPGSGNYKDAALVNKINRIQRFPPSSAPKLNRTTHMCVGRVIKPPRHREDRPIKGLVHDFYSNENVEIVTARQRIFTEDFTNIEMLHNNTSFNLLLNAYRKLASDTWASYYQFKNTDFEKLYNEKKWGAREKRKMELWAKRTELRPGTAEAEELSSLLKPDLSQHFVLPTEYPEVKQKLPVEFRGEGDDPEFAISRPIRYTATYPDSNAPDILNQIEVVKLPNSNALGWDNLRKYANV